MQPAAGDDHDHVRDVDDRGAATGSIHHDDHDDRPILVEPSAVTPASLAQSNRRYVAANESSK
jgi:hypothetical protein